MMPQPEAEHPDKEPQATESEATELESTGSEVEKLKEELKAEKTKVEGYLAGWQRAQADFINYKRRVEQEKEETIKYGNNELINKILPVLDDLELAFAAIPAEEADAAWVKGVKMVERKLKNFLEAQGVAEIKALGQKFDPNIHEAVMQDQGEEGVVVQELQKGYKLGDRVVRPSKVSVGHGEPEKDKEES